MNDIIGNANQRKRINKIIIKYINYIVFYRKYMNCAWCLCRDTDYQQELNQEQIRKLFSKKRRSHNYMLNSEENLFNNSYNLKKSLRKSYNADNVSRYHPFQSNPYNIQNINIATAPPTAQIKSIQKPINIRIMPQPTTNNIIMHKEPDKYVSRNRAGQKNLARSPIVDTPPQKFYDFKNQYNRQSLPNDRELKNIKNTFIINNKQSRHMKSNSYANLNIKYISNVLPKRNTEFATNQVKNNLGFERTIQEEFKKDLQRVMQEEKQKNPKPPISDLNDNNDIYLKIPKNHESISQRSHTIPSHIDDIICTRTESVGSSSSSSMSEILMTMNTINKKKMTNSENNIRTGSEDPIKDKIQERASQHKIIFKKPLSGQ